MSVQLKTGRKSQWMIRDDLWRETEIDDRLQRSSACDGQGHSVVYVCVWAGGY